jgi:hypothetical protein
MFVRNGSTAAENTGGFLVGWESDGAVRAQRILAIDGQPVDESGTILAESSGNPFVYARGDAEAGYVAHDTEARALVSGPALCGSQ